MSKIVLPEVVSRGHIIDRVFVVQSAEAILGITLPSPPVEVTAPVNNNTKDATLYKHTKTRKLNLLSMYKWRQDLTTEIQRR